MSKFVINKYSLDKKSLSALFTFLIWLLFGFLICFVGINNIFADTYYMNYQYSQQYYDNFGSSVTAVTTTWNESLQSYVSDNIGTTANSYGAGLSISSPVPLIKNHTYVISLYFEDLSNIALSNKNHIAIAPSLAGAASNYAYNNYYVDMVQSNVNNNKVLQFVFTTQGGGSFIFIPWTTTYNTTQSYVITQIIMDDLGSEGISQNDINNSLNNQTNEINSFIQESTDAITGEIDDMEQNIVDSNKETQEVIKDQFNSCHYSYNLITQPYPLLSGSIEKNGLIITLNNDYSIKIVGTATASTYINLMRSSEFLNETIRNTDTNRCNNGFCISSGISYDNSNNLYYIGISSGTEVNKTYYPMITTEENKNSNYEPYGEEICTNKLDEAEETRKGIWQTIKELPSMFLDMLLGLFIPDDLSFIDEFKDVISNKLGFIASIPIQIIDFTLGLVNVAFEEITTISFPSIEIFGVHFWNAEEIDITILLEKLKPFKYFTDFTCVILCCRTLYKFYNTFTGGEAN